MTLLGALALLLLVWGACSRPDGPPPSPMLTPTAAPGDWCGGHGVPESACTVCNPELVAGFKAKGDWCDEHSFPESVCPVCNPMKPPAAAVAPAPEGSAAVDWCQEHGVPESACTACNPGLAAGFKAKGDWCDEHGFPESVCPVCNPATSPPGAALPVVKLRSAQTAAAVGIATEVVGEPAASTRLEVTATLAFDENAVAEVRTAQGGIVREVHVEPGQRVEAGEAMFTLESADVSGLQARLGSAREQVRMTKAEQTRQRQLVEQRIGAPRELEGATARLAEAQAELRKLQEALVFANARGSAGRFVVKAPRAGVVIRRPARVGAVVDGDDELGTVADPSTMWVVLDIRASDAARVHLGQPVEVTVEGLGGEPLRAELSWIAAELDAHTRTLAARATLPNPTGVLRAGLFARASVLDATEADVLEVPSAAVQSHPNGAIVFVRTGETTFEPRAVEVLRQGSAVAQVRGALKVGDAVVTTGAFLLKTELVKGSIGAGCCDVKSLDEE